MSANRKGLVTFATIDAEPGLAAALAKTPRRHHRRGHRLQLKGRGGAGFPTGMKWNLAAAAKGDAKYVVCNADEGEPGTFKDRVILTEFADLVFEGMTIGGYAIGAAKGIALPARRVHLPARAASKRARQAARRPACSGAQVLGKAASTFDIEIRMGSGAYVCGEETALIESLEGQRGEPRNRPPFPVDTGFMGQPTIVNNVETLAWVACILAKGAAWFAAIGTEKSTGPKLF